VQSLVGTYFFGTEVTIRNINASGGMIPYSPTVLSSQTADVFFRSFLMLPGDTIAATRHNGSDRTRETTRLFGF
jgi:hypothetical protein